MNNEHFASFDFPYNIARLQVKGPSGEGSLMLAVFPMCPFVIQRTGGVQAGYAPHGTTAAATGASPTGIMVKTGMGFFSGSLKGPLWFSE